MKNSKPFYQFCYVTSKTSQLLIFQDMPIFNNMFGSVRLQGYITFQSFFLAPTPDGPSWYVRTLPLRRRITKTVDRGTRDWQVLTTKLSEKSTQQADEGTKGGDKTGEQIK